MKTDKNSASGSWGYVVDLESIEQRLERIEDVLSSLKLPKKEK